MKNIVAAVVIKQQTAHSLRHAANNLALPRPALWIEGAFALPLSNSVFIYKNTLGPEKSGPGFHAGNNRTYSS